MEFLNLTPHAITVIDDEGEAHTILPSGTVARVATIEAPVGELAGVPVVRRTFGAVEGLPPEGVACLVSALVLGAVPGRAGVYAPDTGPTARRDEKGHIIAVTRLVAA